VWLEALARKVEIVDFHAAASEESGFLVYLDRAVSHALE
jgi:calcineurin-like phosphoesterase